MVLHEEMHKATFGEGLLKVYSVDKLRASAS